MANRYQDDYSRSSRGAGQGQTRRPGAASTNRSNRDMQIPRGASSARNRSTSANAYGRTSGRYGEYTTDSSRRYSGGRVDARANSRRIQNDREDARAYARGAGSYNAKSARKHGRKKKHGVGFKIAVGLGCVILAGAVGIGIYLGVIQGRLNAGVTDDLKDALVQTDYANEPFYMLLMGADNSEERGTADYSTEDANSDSMILVRVDCSNHKVTMVSMHRDVIVEINGKQQKLNAAYAIGGSAQAVKTVAEFCGVDISHFAAINFNGFVDMVDALGGVEVEVPMEIDDELAGGHLDAGWQTLNGQQALILCRARHAYDDYGDGDVYRAANQRMVLSAIAKKILSSDIATIAKSVNTISNYVTTDFAITDLIGIAQALKDIDISTDIYSAMVPTEGVYYEGDGWYEEVLEPNWSNMMARVKQGLSPTTEDKVSESTGTVLASSGSGQIEALGGSSQ